MLVLMGVQTLLNSSQTVYGVPERKDSSGCVPMTMEIPDSGTVFFLILVQHLVP